MGVMKLHMPLNSGAASSPAPAYCDKPPHRLVVTAGVFRAFD
jgi:hypothetical protein